MKYLYFSWISFKRNLVYKFDVIMGYIVVIILGISSKYFWNALVAAGKIPVSELDSYISYSVMSSILGSIFISDLILSISEKIKMGQIASDLQKPIDFQGMLMAESFGTMMGNAVINFLPKFIIMKILLDIYVPTSFIQIIIFIVSCLLGYFIMLALDFIVSLLAFYFVEIWAFWAIKGVVIGFCSGTYLPLWLYPDALNRILDVLPFKYYMFVPINIYLGKMPLGQMLTSILMQAFWLLILAVIGKIFTTVTVKKLTIAGG